MTAYLKSDSPHVSRKHSIVQFKTEKFKIGRSAEADLPLRDVNISRNQCVFVHKDTWTVTDTSSNGVWVNNVRIKKNEPVDLKQGDVILLSEQDQYRWTFNIGAPDPREEGQELPKKKPRRGEKEKEERRRKLVAQARLMRENAVLEDAFKKGEKLQAELQEEKAMLVSRQEQAAKNQAFKDMSSLDQYDFTNSISVITETFTSLLSCSLCSSRMSSTTVFESGQCPHLFCAECHLTISGETCPGTDRFNNTIHLIFINLPSWKLLLNLTDSVVDGCTNPTVESKESKTLSKVADCLNNIEMLLKNNNPEV